MYHKLVHVYSTVSHACFPWTNTYMSGTKATCIIVGGTWFWLIIQCSLVLMTSNQLLNDLFCEKVVIRYYTV